jgi:hypothetical protein
LHTASSRTESRSISPTSTPPPATCGTARTTCKLALHRECWGN